MFEISKLNHILYFFITTTLGTSNLKKFVEDGSVMEKFIDAASGSYGVQMPSKEIVPVGKFSEFSTHVKISFSSKFFILHMY